MSTPSSPDSVSRKPLPISNGASSSRQDGYRGQTENGGRKLLPPIPIPESGRMHGVPMSPVKVNFQSENWPPQASSAVIEDGNGRIRPAASELEVFREGQSDSQASPKVTQGLPFRSEYNAGHAGAVQEPQIAILSSRDSSSSRTPSNGSSSQAGFRGIPERIAENGDGILDQPIPRLQYHHQSHHSDTGASIRYKHPQNPYSPPNDLADLGNSINRHLTPTSLMAPRRTSLQRPQSAYSDMGPRGHSPSSQISQSPYYRAPSANSGRSHDSRPGSYIDLANVSYPQQAPPAILMDNSQLRSAVGSNASLLSMTKTLAMYRENVKKTQELDVQYSFAILLIQCAQDTGLGQDNVSSSGKASPKPARDLESPYVEAPQATPQELLREAKHILQRLSDKGYPFAQYYLADGYASGLFSKGKEDYGTAFPLFVSASKHGHAESGYRAGLCYEYGWGCRKDPAKAVQFYRQSASKNHPGAMTRLGRACLSGDLGLNKYREGLKWLNRATEAADAQYNAAPYHLGLLYETGYGDDVFLDEAYAARLFTQAADLGHAEASYRLGDAYEHGKLSCPRDPALSVHFYTGAAQKGHPAAMMALCAWYMVGAEPILEKDENEAYEWARQAAELGLLPHHISSRIVLTNSNSGLTKAEYAVGYFKEMGIGCRRDPLEANVWYVKAAEAGDERAKNRLAAIRAAASGGTPMEVVPPRNGGKVKKSASGDDKKPGQNEKECIVM